MNVPDDFSDMNQMPCIRQGHTGESVSFLRQLLAMESQGYGPVPMSIINEETEYTFDSDLTAALKSYQRDKGLTVDGIAGPNTWASFGGGVGGGSCGGRSRSGRGGSAQGTSIANTGTYAPFYKQNWFYWTVGGVALAGALALFFVPKKQNRRR